MLDQKKTRVDQVNELVKEEVGKIILREVDIDRNLLLTVTRVKTTANYKSATVYVSVLEKSREAEALDTLEKNIYDIQYRLNRTLRMHPIPKIKFAIDVQGEKEMHLEKLLSDIGEKQKNND